MLVFVCVLGIYNCDEVIYDIKEVLLPPMTTKKNIEKKSLVTLLFLLPI
jgi:hypothetical protein